MARWWPWGGSAADSAAMPESAAPQAVPAPAPVQRAAWQDLPPLQRTLTPTPPIAPLGAFTSSLATANDPSFLAPLGHIVDPDGPSGHVDGLARPEMPRTISTGPELTVPPPRKRSPITSAVQRLIEPRVRFSDPSVVSSPPPVQRWTQDADPAVPATSEPAVDLESVDPAAGPGDSMPAPTAWSLPTVPADAPPVRTAPLLSAPQQPPVGSRPVVALPGSPQLPAGSANGPVASRPAVQRFPVDGELAAATEAGHNEAPAALPAAPLAGQVSMPTVSRITDDGPAMDGAGSGLATAAAPALPPAAGSVARPAVQRSTATGDVTSAASGSAVLDSAGAPAPDGATADPVSAESPAPATAPAADPGPTPAPAADSASDASLAVAPTLSAPTLSAPPASVAPPGAPAVQRHTESSSPTPADRAASPPVRGSGLGAPLTAVPSRPRETVVHEPQAMDFATIMRIIDSAAATGSTEITLPGAPSAPVSSAGPTGPVAPTLGSGRPARPSGLGAPLASGVAPAPVQRSVSTPPSEPSGAEQAGSGTPVQRAIEASAPVVPRSPDLGATPAGVDLASEPAGPAAESGAGEAGPGPFDEAPAPLVAPTIGVETGAPATSPGDEAPPAPVTSLPELPLAGAASGSPTGAAPLPSAVAGPLVQRLAADPWPAVPLMMAPLLGDTSPYRPTPTHPAVPAAPGVSAGPVLAPRSGPSSAAAPAVPAVQRFGLPGASSLLDKAKSGVGGLASQAQGAVGGLRDRAGGYMNQAQQAAGGYMNQAQGAAGGLMNSARGYADQAQQAAGGYANQAQQAAGGYLNQAQGAAGGLMDSARGYADRAQDAAGGYLSQAQQAAGGYVNQAQQAAGGYLNQAQGAAGGLADSAAGYLRSAQGAASNAVSNGMGSATQAVDSAVGSASSAASGAANQLQGAASGVADQASGALSQAGGALGQAASGVTDAVGGAAGSAMHAATGAIGAAAGAAGAAAAGAAEALPTNLDELARRLFDPLSARLKSELWLDRERAGMVTDLRR